MTASLLHASSRPCPRRRRSSTSSPSGGIRNEAAGPSTARPTTWAKHGRGASEGLCGVTVRKACWITVAGGGGWGVGVGCSQVVEVRRSQSFRGGLGGGIGSCVGDDERKKCGEEAEDVVALCCVVCSSGLRSMCGAAMGRGGSQDSSHGPSLFPVL